MVRKCRKGMVEAGCVRGRENPSSTYMQLRSRRIVYVSVDCRSENSSSVGDDDGVSSTNLSCCYSTTTTKSRNVVVNEFIDLEEDRDDDDTETSTYRRSTKRKLFENLGDRESSKKVMEKYSPEIAADFKESSDCCCSGRRTSSTTEEKEKEKSTTEAEIEEFFVEAEKQLQDKFKKKYNFDFEKEKPLKGRYEWVKIEQ